MEIMNYKYKDRQPEDTISIIKNFFINKGYDVRIISNSKKSSGTWSCRVEIYKNKLFILGANGKSTSEIYSLASGFSELYERFCCKCGVFNNALFNLKRQESVLNNNKTYVFGPEERILSIEDIYAIPAFNDSLHEQFKDNITQANRFLNLITFNNIIGLPYKNLSNNEITYIDPRIASVMNRSNGMAAGNTYEEAIVQAISEIYERYAITQLTLTNEQMFYELSKDNIKNEDVKNIIKAIEAQNQELHFFDLSYNFKAPVIGVLCINKSKYNMSLNLGAHPIFDIAIERCLTELYQGIDSYSQITKSQLPSRSINQHRVTHMMGLPIPQNAYIPEQLIYNQKTMITDYNHEIFLDKIQITNEDLKNYYIKLNKTFNTEMFIYNFGLTENMYAVQVIPSIKSLTFTSGYTEYHAMMSDLYYEDELNYLNLKYNFLIHNIFNKNDETNNLLQFNKIKDYFKSLADIANINRIGDSLLSSLWHIQFGDWFNPLSSQITAEQLFYHLERLKNDNQFDSDLNNTIYWQNIQKYRLLENYFSAESYTKDEIKFMCKQFDLDITEDDIKYCFAVPYLTTHLLIQTLYDFYHSTEYEEIVNSYFN